VAELFTTANEPLVCNAEARMLLLLVKGYFSLVASKLSWFFLDSLVAPDASFEMGFVLQFLDILWCRATFPWLDPG
jgi:hypothetical protein